jgi:hypothetical protein
MAGPGVFGSVQAGSRFLWLVEVKIVDGSCWSWYMVIGPSNLCRDYYFLTFGHQF